MMEIISALQYASPEAGSPGLVCGFMVSEQKRLHHQGYFKVHHSCKNSSHDLALQL